MQDVEGPYSLEVCQQHRGPETAGAPQVWGQGVEASVSFTAHSRSPRCVLAKQKTVAESLKQTISFTLTRIKDEGSRKTELAVNHAEAEFRSRYSSNGSGMSGARKAYEELISLSDR